MRWRGRREPRGPEAWVARAMRAFDVPGVALAIVKDGQVVALKGAADLSFDYQDLLFRPVR